MTSFCHGLDGAPEKWVLGVLALGWNQESLGVNGLFLGGKGGCASSFLPSRDFEGTPQKQLEG